jgi:DNA (cytosine-5)-methyltransferase 1
MLRAIREIQPRWVVGENVLGLVNWSGGLVFHEVQADLEAAGYEVWPYVLPAAGVGSCPHRRDRVWFVAYAKDFGSPISKLGKKESGKQIQAGGNINGFKSLGPTPHPNGNGLNQRNGNDEEQSSEGGEYAFGNADTGDEYGDVADTERKRYEWLHKTGDKNFINGESTKIRGSFTGHNKANNWDIFPTQSPICSRNDGISSKLDGITFSKWRNESIKAAGNAIVPQVVYQIFKAIEQYETLPRMADSI